MDAKILTLADRYIVALRICQPARVQELEKAIHSIWPDLKIRSERLRKVHENMREKNRVVSVRRGTYVLTKDGMLATSRLVKERDIDNARMFLMKQQRKRYCREARWLG